jgi:hypothetical protein
MVKILSVVTSHILSIFAVDIVQSYCSCQLFEVPSCTLSVGYSYVREKDLKPDFWSIRSSQSDRQLENKW